jgi:hypothetical protein
MAMRNSRSNVPSEDGNTSLVPDDLRDAVRGHVNAAKECLALLVEVDGDLDLFA